MFFCLLLMDPNYDTQLNTHKCRVLWVTCYRSLCFPQHPSPDVARYKMSFQAERDNDSPHNHQRPALVLAGAITVATQWCLLPPDKVRRMMGGRMVGGRSREGEESMAKGGKKICKLQESS